MQVYDVVLKRITPGIVQSTKVKKVASKLLREVEGRARSLPYPVKVKLVGSVAKDTYVYPPDIDIFVLFPPDVARSELERYGLRLGKEILGGEEKFAEHPYIHGEFDGLDVDIVPCYAIDDPREMKSAVDRTPFHTDYIISRLEARQRDHVRLLKQFMKGVGTYGAEAKVQGFSGYLVELLVLRYGDFQGVLEAAKDWKEGVVLSLDQVRGARFSSPLVFYDPVDHKRNVASALSLQCFSTFIHASREFLVNPSTKFFFPRALRRWSRTRITKEMRRRGTKLVAVQLSKPSLIDDNLYPQVRKTLDGVVATLRAGDFIVIDKGFFIDRAKIYLFVELQTDRLPSAKKHIGPPVTSEQSMRFLDKWQGRSVVVPYIEDGRWVSIIERPDNKACALLQGQLSKASLGSGMRELKGMRVLSHNQLLTSGPIAALTEFLDKTQPWER